MTEQNANPEVILKNSPAVRQHDDDDDEISLVDLAAVLWKHKWLIIGITAFAAIAVLAYAIGSLLLPPEKSYLPNVYTPKATMLIQAGGSSGLSSTLAGLSSLASIAGVSVPGNANGKLAELFSTSNTMLDALNAKFNFTARYKIKKQIISGTREAIKKNVSAKFDEKSNLFTLSFTDIDPAFAKEVIDEMVRLLAERFSVLSGSRLLQQKELLEKKLADVEANIRTLEQQIKAFQNKYGVVQVEALATEQITILARLRSELIHKEMEIANYQKISRVEDPVMLQLKNEREGLLAKIREIETGQGTGSRVMPSQREIPSIAFEYARIQRDLTVQTEVFKILTQQYEIAKLNAAGTEPVFQVLEMAEVPDKKSGPSRGMICIVATIAAFFFSILVAFIAESIEKIRKDPETVARFRAISSGKESL